MRTRLSAAVLSILYHKTVFPLYPSRVFVYSSDNKRKYIPFEPEYTLPIEIPKVNHINCGQVLLNYFPTPDVNTPWERIIEFREDPDTKFRFALFRNWINKINRQNASMEEFVDEYETLVYEYSQYMKMHEMKINPGVLETIFVAGSEFVENIIKLNFGKIAKQFFMFKQRKIDLFESESKAPGREVSYVLKVQKLLSPKQCRRLFGT